MEFLSEINILLIKEICMILNIKVKFSKSSSLNIQKKRSHKIVEICNLKLKKQLLSNEGTINYINHAWNDCPLGKLNWTAFCLSIAFWTVRYSENSLFLV